MKRLTYYLTPNAVSTFLVTAFRPK